MLVTSQDSTVERATNTILDQERKDKWLNTISKLYVNSLIDIKRKLKSNTK